MQTDLTFSEAQVFNVISLPSGEKKLFDAKRAIDRDHHFSLFTLYWKANVTLNASSVMAVSHDIAREKRKKETASNLLQSDK